MGIDDVTRPRCQLAAGGPRQPISVDLFVRLGGAYTQLISGHFASGAVTDLRNITETGFDLTI